jgi:nicotinamidase/pyrazinamidase
MQAGDALLIVDLQNDFCPGGALPVVEGDKVVPAINRYIEAFQAAHLPIIATRDWHPEMTSHFNTYGGIWPPHCIQGTNGSAFHLDLKLPEAAVIISKGMDPQEDSYSGFQGTDAKGAKLADLLRQRGVKRLFVGGLATDYCVKHTVIDGLKEGFKVILLEDAVRGVEIHPGDSKRAVEEMLQAGVQRTSDASLL